MNKSSKLIKQIWEQSKMFASHSSPVANSPERAFLLRQYPDAQYSHLKNGLRIATEERSDVTNACIGLYIDGGSRYENEFENGIAHFFEHLAFKSTRSRDSKVLYTAMERSGATFRASTTRDMVVFYVQCLAPQVPLAFELLIDCLYNNRLSAGDIEIQKKYVYAEMLQHDNDSNELVYDLLHSAAYQGTGLEKSVVGRSANLYNFNESTISLYLNRMFHPMRTVLAACGAIKHGQIEQLACQFLNFADVSHCPPSECYRYTGSEVRYRNDSMPVGNVIMAVEGPSFTQPENVCMEVARIAVGSWDRCQLDDYNLLPTRLAKRVSTYHCDAFQAININYRDTGLWGVHFIADCHSLDDMSIAIQEEWMYLCTCITKSEVERAKKFYITNMLSNLQKVKLSCHDLGKWTLYRGSRPKLSERMDSVENMTAADVRKVAMQYIYDKCPVVAAVGQTEGLMDYNRLRGQMYWLRY